MLVADYDANVKCRSIIGPKNETKCWLDVCSSAVDASRLGVKGWSGMCWLQLATSIVDVTFLTMLHWALRCKAVVISCCWTRVSLSDQRPKRYASRSLERCPDEVSACCDLLNNHLSCLSYTAYSDTPLNVAVD